ncbi:MAG: sulfite exporter TauE/SafE family protein [bacterium]
MKEYLPVLISIFAASLAGFSRGFCGFGAAIIYIPLVSIAYDPVIAVVTLFLVDILPSLPIVYKSFRKFDYSLVVPMLLGAIIFSPMGVFILLTMDKQIMELIIGVLIFVLTVRLLTNYQPLFAASKKNSVIFGSISGIFGGAAGLYGPPAILYLLGASNNAKQTRRNIFVFLTIESVFLGAYYLFYDMYTAQHFHITAYLLPFYAFTIWLGSRKFVTIDENGYRKILMGILIMISLVLVVNVLYGLRGT